MTKEVCCGEPFDCKDRENCSHARAAALYGVHIKEADKARIAANVAFERKSAAPACSCGPGDCFKDCAKGVAALVCCGDPITCKVTDVDCTYNKTEVPRTDMTTTCCGDPSDCESTECFALSAMGRKGEEALYPSWGAPEYASMSRPYLKKATPLPPASWRELLGDPSLERNEILDDLLARQKTPDDSEARKNQPMATGLLDYFPLALADIARLSKIGNDKHNPGEPMHWAREKSTDHADCILRHMTERGTIDTDEVLHDTKVAWRALAQLQLAIEKLRAKGEYL